MSKKRIVIIGGGTHVYISSHFAISAPARGSTACRLSELCQMRFNGDDAAAENHNKCDSIMEVWTYLTNMGGGPTMGLATHEFKRKYPGEKPTLKAIADFRPTHLDTNEDVSKLVDEITADDTTRIVFFNAAMCDWMPSDPKAGKYAKRLKTSEHPLLTVGLVPAHKIINKVRATRKDIFLVGFKTTTGDDDDAMYIAGLDLCKRYWSTTPCDG